LVADPYLVLFCGGLGGSEVEDLVADALRESALDTLDEALGTGAFAGAVVVADAPAAANLASRLPAGVALDVDPPGEAFHFGRRLAEIVRRYELERPLYVGCGLPLIKSDDFLAIATALRNGDRAVVSNNFYSADLIGFVPGSVIADVDLPDNDRILPRILSLKHGLANQALPRTIANQFDLDTPLDLAVLAYAGGAGPRLQAYLDANAPDTSRLATAARFFTDPDAEVIVAGRVGSQVWQFLEAETACRVRVYSEERGMQAAGRDSDGEARSLLGYHIDAVGPERFFAELAEMADAAFIDTRVILAHAGRQPSRRDRFHSDLLAADAIEDEYLRRFTAAAADAPIPVVIGASTLVRAGVQLLSEAAWRERDRARRDYKPMGRASG
jgi:hypothetical protein